MSRVSILVTMIPLNIAKLEEIGRMGLASSTYSQDFQFVLDRAIEEFIKKYEEELKTLKPS